MAKKNAAQKLEKELKATVKGLSKQLARAEEEVQKWQRRAKKHKSALGLAQQHATKLEQRLRTIVTDATAATPLGAVLAPAPVAAPDPAAPASEDAAALTKPAPQTAEQPATKTAPSAKEAAAKKPASKKAAPKKAAPKKAAPKKAASKKAVSRPAAKKAPTKAADQPAARSAEPDASWSVAELRAAARTRGITGYSRKTKQQLLGDLSH